LILFRIIFLLLFSSSVFAEGMQGDTSSSKDIESNELKQLNLDDSGCDGLQDRFKCAEYIISKYNQDNNLYSSIDYNEFANEYFDNSGDEKLEDILKMASDELEEAKDNQETQFDGLGDLVAISDVEAKVFSTQELEIKKLRKLFSRVVDAMVNKAMTVELKSKVKTMQMSLLLNEVQE